MYSTHKTASERLFSGNRSEMAALTASESFRL
jgi:hypothetical protein